MGTHWSVRTLARHLGVGVGIVQSVLPAESLQPHRFQYWKDSPDPEFEPKMLAIVGLYLRPPHNAVVLSVDEKTSIQALDRTQPRLPLKPHRIERLSHEYKRNCAGSWPPIRNRNFTSSLTTGPPIAARKPWPGWPNSNGFT